MEAIERERERERWERRVDTWMGLVSLYSLMACSGISSFSSHTPSHHSSEDLAAETKHLSNAALSLDSLRLTPRWEKFALLLKADLLCIITNNNRSRSCMCPAMVRYWPLGVTNSLWEQRDSVWERCVGQSGSGRLRGRFSVGAAFSRVVDWLWFLHYLYICLISHYGMRMQYVTGFCCIRMSWCARNNTNIWHGWLI